jgi:hypothetical protein
MRRFVIVVLAVTAACSSGKPGLERKIPQVVNTGGTAACKADTATLKAMEETAFASDDGYRDQTTPLHKVTAGNGTYTITIVDKRCGTVGHTVGQTPTDY